MGLHEQKGGFRRETKLLKGNLLSVPPLYK